jgi:putative oxidoreductase
VSQTFDLSKIRERFHTLGQRVAFLGPTLARLTVGLVFVGTGWGKLQDMPGTIENFAGWHIPFPSFNAHLAAGTELVGGLLMLAGLGVRFAALPMAFTMVVAIIAAKRGDIDGLTTLVGFEEWSYIVLFLWIAIAGAGPLSLDRLVWPRLLRLLEKKSASPQTAPA